MTGPTRLTSFLHSRKGDPARTGPDGNAADDLMACRVDDRNGVGENVGNEDLSPLLLTTTPWAPAPVTISATTF